MCVCMYVWYGMVRMYVCMYVCVGYVCMYVSVYMYVCMYVYVCVNMYHIYLQNYKHECHAHTSLSPSDRHLRF
jgi:hypothetical protein